MKEKRLFLTFDDGPDPRYTNKLLDVLREEEVKATFFVVGENAENNSDIIKRMVDEGHDVGSHTYKHRNALFMTRAMSKRDMEKCLEVNEKIIGKKTLYFRPPWGIRNTFTRKQAESFGMKLILWDVMAEDWEKKATVKSIEKKLLDRVKNNYIICLHDAGEKTGGAKDAPLKTIEALKRVLPHLKNQGYRFCGLEELDL